MKIKIIKKNIPDTTEYEIGDLFETEGIWYGGVHIKGKTGVPISLDKDLQSHILLYPVYSF